MSWANTPAQPSVQGPPALEEGGVTRGSEFPPRLSRDAQLSGLHGSSL